MKIVKIVPSSKLSRLAEKLTRGKKRERRGPLLHTGSTLLNLALSDDPSGGFMAGRYFYLVGDSTSGKTFLSMTCFAEASRDPTFKDHRLIYDNAEDGMLMNVAKLFGSGVAKRMEPPDTHKGLPVFSETIEDFYYHIDDAVKEGKPFIYVLDSMDSLTSVDEDMKFDKTKRAALEGKSIAGSYGDGKAKKNSAGLRKMLRGLRKTGSIVIIISQTRDAINAMWGETKTHAGGRALRFYATAEIWSSVIGTIKKKVRGKDRKVGVKVQLQVKKNRITGKLHSVQVPIYPSYGIDDVGSCVEFLMEEGWWKKGKGGIRAEEVGVTGERRKIIAACEGHPGEWKRAVGSCWKALAEESELEGRRPRYE